MKNFGGSATALGLLLTLPAMALLANQPALAQDSQPVQLQGITVTAAGDWLGEADPEVVRTHAGGRSVVRQEQFEQSGASTVTEAIRAIPGVQTPPPNGSGGGDYALNIGIRGMTSRLSAGATILMDGIPLANALYGQPETSLGAVSLGMLQAIDVVKGGGSVRYGPGTSGGVVNFVTKDIPTTPYGGEISLRGDSTAGNDANGRLLGKSDIMAGGSLQNGSGLAVFYSGNHGESYRDNTNQDIDDFMLKGRLALTETSRLETRLRHYNADASTPGPLTQAAFNADPYQSTHSRERFKGERDEYVLKYVNEFNGDYRLETTGFHTESFRELTIASAAATSVNGGSDASLTILDRLPRNYSVYGFEPRFTALAETGIVKHAASIGYRYMTEATDEMRFRRTGAAGFNPFGVAEARNRYTEGSTEAHAVYVDNAMKVGAVTVTPGIRFEKVEVERLNKLTGFRDTEKYEEPLPSLSVGWEVNRDLFTYANYSTSFNPVTHLALGDSTAAGAGSLEPERAKTYEIGARYKAGGLSLEGGLFLIHFDNQIESVNSVNINTGATKHQGIETAAEYDLGTLYTALKGLSVYATYAYTEATREQGANAGRQLGLYSPHVGTVGTRYRTGEWTFNLNAYGQSEQHADDTNTVESSANGKLGPIQGYVLFNGQVAYDFPSGVTVAAGVNNIFDELYFTRASIEANGGLFAGAPRTAYITTKFVF
ncbi:TonB-dependent siderophore receptor [Ferrovibrio terrae]|uniref:TonB-dependent receptor family protein n=1 Tax=Ferrovibrio terrae TaxID=2594003 RepID=UPI003137734D